MAEELLLERNGKPGAPLTRPLLAVAFLASFGSSMLYGYNLAVVNSPAQVGVTPLLTRGKKNSNIPTVTGRTRSLSPLRIALEIRLCTSRVGDQVVYFTRRRVGVHRIARLLEPHRVIDVLWILPRRHVLCSVAAVQ
ncbi:hypothetical protein EYF80_062129 [Liparis tanakae]|uniref:Solute carrier family 2, facilitated glucose transporter member 9 n=1 Tax=Liparis tanakae TaxID=230148 RepID=A0A4Z2EG23_9TELE|nr:hypothetical protein EYF80_062129 [Liparis tanakae]